MRNPTTLTIALLSLLGLATQLLIWINRPKEAEPSFIGPPRSEYTLNDFQLNALNSEGKLAFTVIAPRLTRRGSDSSISVDTPNYVLVDGNGTAWKGQSNSAWVNKDGSLIKLEGAVEMHRDATALLKPARIVTADVTAQMKEKLLETAAPATITEPGSILRGIGMKANLTTHQLELLADVHVLLQPKSQPSR